MKEKSVLRQLEELPYLMPYIDLVKSSIRMDVFSELTQPRTAAELALKRGWHEGNTAYMLGALVSIGFLRKEGSAFVDTEGPLKPLQHRAALRSVSVEGSRPATHSMYLTNSTAATMPQTMRRHSARLRFRLTHIILSTSKWSSRRSRRPAPGQG